MTVASYRMALTTLERHFRESTEEAFIRASHARTNLARAVLQSERNAGARDPWLPLARFFLEQNNLSAAESACRQAIRAGSRNALYLLAREIYWNRRRSADSVISLLGEGRVRWLHEDPPLLSVLGMAYLRTGESTKAYPLFHQLFRRCQPELRRMLFCDLRQMAERTGSGSEEAMHILSWFGLSSAACYGSLTSEEPLHDEQMLNLSGMPVPSLSVILDKRNDLSLIRLVDISGTQIRDLSALQQLPMLEELVCYGMSEPQGLLALVSMPRLRRIYEHRALNEWERHRFRQLRPDVVMI